MVSLLVFGAMLQAVPYEIQAVGVDADSRKRVETALVEGRRRVEDYFGAPFPKKFVVFVGARRAQFDAETARRWKMPPSERWMVGAGVADVLILLSPGAWKEEADDHDATSDRELGEIVAHELTHVYHAQRSPNPMFDGMDDMGWFIEGLAVLVSGQLEGHHAAVAKEAIATGRAPTSLAAAWSGRLRYGVCGSMAAYVDAHWGRAKVADLLSAASNASALDRLGVTEPAFLSGWQAWVTEGNRLFL